MNLLVQEPKRPRTNQAAGMTFVEVMVGIGVLSIMAMSLYSGFTFVFAEIRLAQENVRATQILVERMEVIRMLKWDQVVNSTGFVPKTFTAPFYADNPAKPPLDGFVYTGTVLVTNCPSTESYATNMRIIQIQVSWRSGSVTRRRQMTSLISKYGMQDLSR